MAKAKADKKPTKRRRKSKADLFKGRPAIFAEDEDIPTDIDELATEINKRINEGRKIKRSTVRRADETGNPFTLRRPTGLASLDIGTGGGLPAGGVTQIDGETGVGKDALCNLTVAMNQGIYGELSRVFWCQLELPYDKSHGRRQGVAVPSSPLDIQFENAKREAEGAEPMTKDEITRAQFSIGQFALADAGPTENRLQAVLDVVHSNICQLVVVDSLAAATSHYRIETPLENETAQAVNAKMLTDWQHILWHNFLNPLRGVLNLTTMVVTNQVRANMNRISRRSPATKEQSPHSIKHAKLLDITLKPGEYINRDGQQVGKVVKWRITKGKAGVHEGASGEVKYYYATGFDRVDDLANVMMDFDMILHAPKAKTCDIIDNNGEVVVEKCRWGSRGSGVRDALYADPDLFEKMYYACLQNAGVSCLHKL